MLTDHQWREIQYAVEYAVAAIADRTSHEPDPPGQAWFDLRQVILEDEPQRIAAPIPVPHDWKPAYPLLQQMVEEQPDFQIGEQIGQLKSMVLDNLGIRPVNRYLGTAHRYLLKARRYLRESYIDQVNARIQKEEARSVELRAKLEVVTAKLEKMRAKSKQKMIV